jgi:hypothetical protein
MDFLWNVLIMLVVAWIAIILSFRIRPIHKLVYGKASAHMHDAAVAAAGGPR